VVNSHLLYRLSYRGVCAVGTPDNQHGPHRLAKSSQPRRHNWRFSAHECTAAAIPVRRKNRRSAEAKRRAEMPPPRRQPQFDYLPVASHLAIFSDSWSDTVMDIGAIMGARAPLRSPLLKAFSWAIM